MTTWRVPPVNGTIAAAWLLSAAAPMSLTAQAAADPVVTTNGSARVVAGPRFEAGWVHRLFLGDHWRDLWTLPVEVNVLDLAATGGGLAPTKVGGGQQTRSLRLAGGDGREYVFRLLDKNPTSLLPAELRGTVAERVVYDQFSASHPAGALVVPPILEAAGVLGPEPRLVVLPDDPALGEFRAEFGGRLGLFEERPTESDEELASFAGADNIIGSDNLFEKVQESADDRVHARQLLAARLIDILLGDWDRHRDQWRWARFNDSTPTIWHPIPRDRDQAFADFDGLLLALARNPAPQLVTFGPDYPYMVGLTWNGRELDRRFLAELERPVWDSTARALQAAITDAVIDDAVSRLPDAYRAASGAALAAALRQRRDRLPGAADRFYRVLAQEVEVHATDEADRLEVTRIDDDTTEVALFTPDDAQPYFRRRLSDRETNEVRIHLHGGDDRGVVRGPGATGTLVRVVGGEGRDALADSARGRTKFYDGPEPNEAGHVTGADVDRRPYREPKPTSPRALPPRDWGERWLPLGWAGAGPDLGVFLGAGVTRTKYGFRSQPFASRLQIRAGYSTGASTYRAELSYVRYRENSRTRHELLARASGIEIMRFHGFGNEIAAPGPSEFYRVTSDRYSLDPRITLGLGERASFSAGPTLVYTEDDRRSDRILGVLAPYGTGGFGQAGLRAELLLDGRDIPAAARRGVLFRVAGSVYPAVWDVEEIYGQLSGEAATYLSPALPLAPTLALRVGGQRVWGRYPYFDAAFIGDPATVRLGRQNRYGGDAAAFANAELRVRLGRIFVLVPGEIGVFGLGDVGRVFLEGESSDVWHTAVGGGLWVSFLGPANTVTATVAKSDERTGVYVGAGFGF